MVRSDTERRRGLAEITVPAPRAPELSSLRLRLCPRCDRLIRSSEAPAASSSARATRASYVLRTVALRTARRPASCPRSISSMERRRSFRLATTPRHTKLVTMSERWTPQSLDELRSFLSDGYGEDHYREFKEQLPANRRIARQLAGFAIDGGDLYVGVAERDGGFAVAPTELSGLPERIEQVAQTLVDPPLLVETHPLRDQGNQSKGVLRISIPPSPEAPHQVSGTYYERGDKQTRPMPDGAVERLIRSRRTTLERIESTLAGVIRNDPLQPDGRAHVMCVAQPIGSAPEELYDAVDRSLGGDWLRVRDALQRTSEDYSLGSHHWRFMYSPGVNLRPGPVGGHRFVPAVPEGVNCELVVSDDGRVEYFSDAASDEFRGEQCLFPEAIIGSLFDVIVAIRSVAAVTGRRRSWDVGFAVVHAQGLYPRRRDGNPLAPLQPFPSASYTRATRVSTLDLDVRPWHVVRKLVRPFIESCGLSFEEVARPLGSESTEADGAGRQ